MERKLIEATNKYDSTNDTLVHMQNIKNTFDIILSELKARQQKHDNSKLASPEKEMYDKYIPILRKYKYGTPEYKSAREEMYNAGLKHHYGANRHHPEHFENGIVDMNLVDMVEMFADWYSASLVSDTDFLGGLEINKKRYNMPDELAKMFENTYKEYFTKEA